MRQRTGGYIGQIQDEILKCAERDYNQREFVQSAIFLISTRDDLFATLQTKEGRISMRNALSHAATLGLSLNPSLGEATLVVYSGCAQYQPMKNGLIRLALDTGLFDFITTDAVHENDAFQLTKTAGGDDFAFAPARKDRGAPTGYYAACKLKSGVSHVVWRTREEIETHRDKYARAPKKYPDQWTWKKSFDAMAKKTVLKILINTIRVSPILGRATEIDEPIDVEATVIRRPRGGATADDVKQQLDTRSDGETWPDGKGTGETHIDNAPPDYPSDVDYSE
jgi:phage RecT family recombinase